ncbi:hypothetical protein LINGRAHAP2_LOCUS34006 [Linum grandiflorum]
MKYSSSKNLMIAVLLIVAFTDATTDEQSCSNKSPSGHGPCTSDFAGCIDTMLVELVDNTPYSTDKKFTATYPTDGQPSGGFTGHATCVATSSETDCLSCLRGARAWLFTHCRSKGHYYYGVCTMSFQQIP